MRMRFAPYALLLLLAALAGCGQKGPLYLPVTPPRTIPPMPQAATHPPAATTHPAPAAATHSAQAAKSR